MYKPQTAIRGVFSVGIIKVLAYAIGYGKHIVITAYIGLSAQLDSFYMAMTVLNLLFFAFGDIFDSVGIPFLVETLQKEGEKRFKDLAGSIFTLSIFMSAALGIVLLLVAPWTPLMAPGFSPERKEFIIRNLTLLSPVAVLQLPYHAIGSFLRAKRRFYAFYVGEIIIATVSLAVVFLGRDMPYVIPVAFSTAQIVAFLYVYAIGRRELNINFNLREEKIPRIIRMLVSLLPFYLAIYLSTFVDRAFASYLPTGSVSALSYGLLIASIPVSIMRLESVFITPLSESGEKGEMLRSIVNGIIIISVPVAFFTIAYADNIVKAAFERGVFTEGSTKMTGDALRYFALSIPVLLVLPIMSRLFQILGKIKVISMLSFGTVLTNGTLNYIFMKMGMGIKGLALATSISFYLDTLGAVIFLRKFGITMMTKDVFQVFLISTGVSAATLGLVFYLPMNVGTVVELVFQGAIFVLVAAFFFWIVPNDVIRYWRRTVLSDLLPRWRG